MYPLVPILATVVMVIAFGVFTLVLWSLKPRGRQKRR